MNPRVSFSTLFALVALVLPAMGVIVINSDETENLTTPPDGSPWQYVARMNNQFGARASGVYLGSRYILTADHIDNDINVVNLNGTNYTVDSSYTPVVLSGTDMRILRIVQDPGLPRLPLIRPWDAEFNQPCTMMGFGVGKGTPIPNQGWNWGDDTTRLKRWATNTTLGSYYTDPVTHIDYVVTAFDRSAGPREGQITGGDSGGALFIKYDGTWRLAGIGVDVDVDNASLYDKDTSTPGDQPDHSYFASVKDVVSQILAIVPATDEPIAVTLVPGSVNSLQLYWPASATTWNLFKTNTLNPPNWTQVTTTPTVTGGFNMLTMPTTLPAQFYQLRNDG